jgi:signal transduction histidine kinase
LLIERDVVTRDADLLHEVEQIRKAGNLLLSMVQKLLELEQCETETWDLSYENVAVAAVVNEALRNLTPLNLKRQNKIVVNVPKTMTLSTDRSYLIHILTNLLDNAIKFTEDGIISIDASLDQANQQDNIVLTIADTGIGIDTRDLPRVFEAFYQAPASMTWPFHGTGIGLSVCREYTQRLGGTLTVDSTIGTGTVFTVVLPRTSKE